MTPSTWNQQKIHTLFLHQRQHASPPPSPQTPTQRLRLRNCATAGGPSTKSSKGIQGILNGSRIWRHQVQGHCWTTTVILDLRLLDAWKNIQTYSPNGVLFSWLWIPWFLIRKEHDKKQIQVMEISGNVILFKPKSWSFDSFFPEGSSLYMWQPYENMGDILNIIWCRISPNSISCEWFRNSQAFGIDGNNKGFFQMKKSRYMNSDSGRVYFLRTYKRKHVIWVFPTIMVPQNGWFIMENPIKMG